MKTVEERLAELNAEADQHCAPHGLWRIMRDKVAKQLTQQAAEWQIKANEEKAAGEATLDFVMTAREHEWECVKRSLRSGIRMAEDQAKAHERQLLEDAKKHQQEMDTTAKELKHVYDDNKELRAKLRSYEEAGFPQAAHVHAQELRQENDELRQAIEQRDAELARMVAVNEAQTSQLWQDIECLKAAKALQKTEVSNKLEVYLTPAMMRDILINLLARAGAH